MSGVGPFRTRSWLSDEGAVGVPSGRPTCVTRGPSVRGLGTGIRRLMSTDPVLSTDLKRTGDTKRTSSTFHFPCLRLLTPSS